MSEPAKAKEGEDADKAFDGASHTVWTANQVNHLGTHGKIHSFAAQSVPAQR